MSADLCDLVCGATAPGGVAVADYRLASGYEYGRHTHAHPSLALGLRGAYVARLGRREHVLGPGDVLVFPDGAAHRERVGDRGSHCLLLQVAAVTDDPRLAASFRRDRVLPSPAIGRLARLLAVEVAARDSAQAIALDALIADILDELASQVGGPRDEATARGRPGWVHAVREELDGHYLDPPSLAALAVGIGRTREHVARTFRRAFGATIGDYVRARRLDHAARALSSTDTPVAAVAAEAGFADQSHLTRWFRRRYGTTPAAYRAARR